MGTGDCDADAPRCARRGAACRRRTRAPPLAHAPWFIAGGIATAFLESLSHSDAMATAAAGTRAKSARAQRSATPGETPDDSFAIAAAGTPGSANTVVSSCGGKGEGEGEGVRVLPRVAVAVAVAVAVGGAVARAEGVGVRGGSDAEGVSAGVAEGLGVGVAPADGCGSTEGRGVRVGVGAPPEPVAEKVGAGEIVGGKGDGVPAAGVGVCAPVSDRLGGGEIVIDGEGRGEAE